MLSIKIRGMACPFTELYRVVCSAENVCCSEVSGLGGEFIYVAVTGKSIGAFVFVTVGRLFAFQRVCSERFHCMTMGVRLWLTGMKSILGW